MKKLIIACAVVALLLFPVTWKPLLVPDKTQTFELIEENTTWRDGDSLHIVLTEVGDSAFGYKLEQLVYAANQEGIYDFHLHLNNGGGSGLDMFDIIDTVEHLKQTGRIAHLTTYARGCIASAAVPIFCMGDTRVAYANTQFMIHPCGGWNHPMLEPCERILVAEISIRYCQYVASRTNMTFQELWEILCPEDEETTARTGQYWFNASEALRLGFATEWAGWDPQDGNE